MQYIGPNAESLPKLITSFLNWIDIQKSEAKMHPVLLAGLLHYIFISIHPFSDGNGRTTRLLTLHYLRSEKYTFNDSLSLDAYYLQNKKEYYSALSRGKNFEDRMFADLTPFLTFFIRGFLESTKVLTKYVQIGKIFDKTRKPVQLNQEEIAIVDYVYLNSSISLEEAIQITSATRRTTQRRLKNLVDKRILKSKEKGPALYYVLKKTKI